MIAIQPNEFDLRGGVKVGLTAMEFDDVSKRIYYLIENSLVELGSDESGWFRLFQDPNDLRYWELFFPNSEQHGGGAPALQNISIDAAKKRYKI